ncbi:MAG: ABC transporter ATP-binding protein [bacterium]|nr:ABC transporter ATP-binding protein [bacterium]
MRISLLDVSMSFDDAGRRLNIFHGVNLEIASGDTVAIVGRSGVGKTTLTNIIGGLEIPTAGEVTIGDYNLRQLWQSPAQMTRFRGSNVGFIFQSHHLLPEFSALENVALPLFISGESMKTASNRAEDLLTEVGLAERLHHRPGMLSGGEQQRVAIARSLVANPGLILADEPTGSLDPTTGEEVSRLLLNMQAEKKFTMIIVTHSPELASRMGQVLELTAEGVRQT